jgi:anti-anti-sigma factor
VKPFEVIESPTASGARFVELALRGYLDAHTVSDFETRMDRLIEQGGRCYLIDINELNYVSSAGIGAIMSLTQRLRRSNGEIVLVRPTDKVFKILDKLGFTKIFRLAYSREEAEKLLDA